jgi:hypothetical protein
MQEQLSGSRMDDSDNASQTWGKTMARAEGDHIAVPDERGHAYSSGSKAKEPDPRALPMQKVAEQGCWPGVNATELE